MYCQKFWTVEYKSRRELAGNHTDVLGEADVLPAEENASRDEIRDRTSRGGPHSEVDLLATEDDTVSRLISAVKAGTNETVDGGSERRT